MDEFENDEPNNGAVIPHPIIANLAGDSEAHIIRITKEEPITTSSGAATGQVIRYVGEFSRSDGQMETFCIIRKSLRPATSERHAAFVNIQDHWTYWRRELLAYDSYILPTGPNLIAPKCYGIGGNNLYLEDIVGSGETIDRAARHLAYWQATTTIPDLPWLTRDQLGQRIQTTTLNWNEVDADPRVVTLWNRRDELLQKLANLPRVLSHGDYSLGNMIARGHETVVLDWGTLGIAPVGSDLAHLALSGSANPTPHFLEAAQSHWPTQDVVTGFQATLALVGASRTHWMLTRGSSVPDWYVDFLWDNQPH